MVQRLDAPKDITKEEDIPVIPNYLDLILGEINAIRIILEEQQKKKG